MSDENPSVGRCHPHVTDEGLGPPELRARPGRGQGAADGTPTAPSRLVFGRSRGLWLRRPPWGHACVWPGWWRDLGRGPPPRPPPAGGPGLTSSTSRSLGIPERGRPPTSGEGVAPSPRVRPGPGSELCPRQERCPVRPHLPHLERGGEGPGPAGVGWRHTHTRGVGTQGARPRRGPRQPAAEPPALWPWGQGSGTRKRDEPGVLLPPGADSAPPHPVTSSQHLALVPGAAPGTLLPAGG